MNNSGITPKGHRILILPDQVEQVSDSGIIVKIGEYSDREQMAQMEGRVIAVGNTAYADQPAPWCQEGDRVIFAKYSGHTFKGKDGLEYRIISDLDIVATLEKDEIYE